MRRVVAATAVLLSACSVWAILADPYKTDPIAGDAGDARPTPSDGASAAAPSRAIDAGFTPSALGSFGDTVYVLDDQAQVHVAYDAGLRFTSFWSGDTDAAVLIQKNAIAANSAGVFWTLATGVRYCAVDGGGCGTLASVNARAIAANDSVIAWIDDTGVHLCTTPLDVCSPAAVASSKSAARLAVGPNGEVAWTDGGATIEIASPSGAAALGSTSLSAGPYEATVIATDTSSGMLYWEGPTGIGVVAFDGGSARSFGLQSSTKPTALFVDHGVAYWSLEGPPVVQHCRFDVDAGCLPADLASGLRMPTTVHEIVVDSRKVIALFSSDLSLFPPVLAEWPVPP